MQIRILLEVVTGGLVLMGALMLGSCAGSSSIRTDPPTHGKAAIDVTPDSSHRDRVDGIRLVSVNGSPHKGSEAELSPGKNRVRVAFDWPQIGRREVDLDFNAKAGIIYAVYYDVYPPLADSHRPFGSAVVNDDSSVLVVPIALPAMMMEGGIDHAQRHSKAAHYVDVRVVAQHSSQGIACTRRVYPDGSVSKR